MNVPGTNASGRARQHTIGDNAKCYGIIMFELNVVSVVAGGEVMNGGASPLSPEHTGTIPLSDYPFTDTVRARGLNCGEGSATPRADGRFVIYTGLYGNRGDNPHAPPACAAQPRRAGWQHQRGWEEGHAVQEAHVQGVQLTRLVVAVELGHPRTRNVFFVITFFAGHLCDRKAGIRISPAWGSRR